MVRPAAFGFNEETAGNNYFQQNVSLSSSELQDRALEEFDRMVELLRKNYLDVMVIEDNPDPPKPDAIFPNNWLATYPGGILSVFPMYAISRRLEKRDDIVRQLINEYVVKDFQDWSEFEAEGRFLSTDREGRPVYHSNVVMTLGEKFCVLCEESIEEEWELIAVRQLLESTGHIILPISREQMHCFAGNMLEAYARLLPIAVPTIEKVEGGSVRCMIAEIFLEKK